MRNFLRKIWEWVGYDGLLNMETSFIIYCIMFTVLSELPASLLTLSIVTIKTCIDRYHKHEGELHDFICCLIGIVVSMFLMYGIVLHRRVIF